MGQPLAARGQGPANQAGPAEAAQIEWVLADSTAGDGRNLWIPEAARILRPGGQLVFLVNGAILMLCAPDAEDEPATDRLLRDYFGMHRFEWSDDPSVEFHLGYGDMIRLLRRCGFEVEDMIEVRPREDATTSYPYAPVAWARRWPAEEVWKALKRTP